jgi:cytochrome c oxidase subunit 4
MTGARSLVATWLGLLALLAITAASSRIDLGPANGGINLAIAAAKALLILAIFMRLREQAQLPRLAALVVLLWAAIMFLLTGADYFAR